MQCYHWEKILPKLLTTTFKEKNLQAKSEQEDQSQNELLHSKA